MHSISRLANCSLARRVLGGGGSPRQLSAAVCLAAALGVLPCPGATPLGALLATRLGLNQALVQGVNFCCYPLQLALFLPFCRLGALFFPWEAEVTAETLGMLDAGLAQSLGLAAKVVITALWGWLLTVPPLALMLFPLLRWWFNSTAVSRRLRRYKVKELEP